MFLIDKSAKIKILFIQLILSKNILISTIITNEPKDKVKSIDFERKDEEMGINHRGHGGEIGNSLCTPEKYPSAGITKKIIGCCHRGAFNIRAWITGKCL